MWLVGGHTMSVDGAIVRQVSGEVEREEEAEPGTEIIKRIG